MSVGYPSDWPQIRERVLERDGNECQHCGDVDDLHVHHIVPVAAGGSDEPKNLVTLCERCHRAAHREIDAPSRGDLEENEQVVDVLDTVNDTTIASTEESTTSDRSILQRYREAPIWKRWKWWVFGMDDVDESETSDR